MLLTKYKKETSNNNKVVNPRDNRIFVNIYAPNIGASKYIKQIQIDIKGEIDSNTKIIPLLTSFQTENQ